MAALTVYRVTKAAYAHAAFAGSRRRGRWHRLGAPAVYCADAPATALLETLAHAERAALLAAPYVVFRVTLDADRHVVRLPADLLPAEWAAWPWPASTQDVGPLRFESATSVAGCRAPSCRPSGTTC